MKMIGAADEFWRVRLTRVDASDTPDFEWRDDILYRTPATALPNESERWQVEAIRLEDYEAVVTIRVFQDRDEAESLLERVREDLADMTKNEFEDAYLTAAHDPDAEDGSSVGG